MSDHARTGGEITPERFMGIVRYTRQVMDAHAERQGLIAPSTMEPFERTARYVRLSMMGDGIAPEWLLGDTWLDFLPLVEP